MRGLARQDQWAFGDALKMSFSFSSLKEPKPINPWITNEFHEKRTKVEF